MSPTNRRNIIEEQWNPLNLKIIKKELRLHTTKYGKVNTHYIYINEMEYMILDLICLVVSFETVYYTPKTNTCSSSYDFRKIFEI